MRLANGVAKILSFDELKPVFSDFTTGIFSSFLMISTTSCLFSASLVSISEESSPSSNKMAIISFTLMPVDPSGTIIFPITPSSTASNSIVALSVSISAITSPLSTVSPSLTNHFASVPSSIVGERAGI